MTWGYISVLARRTLIDYNIKSILFLYDALTNRRGVVFVWFYAAASVFFYEKNATLTFHEAIKGFQIILIIILCLKENKIHFLYPKNLLFSCIKLDVTVIICGISQGCISILYLIL